MLPNTALNRKLLVALSLIFSSTFALGADNKLGRFWHGGGVGATECPMFVATMEHARKQGTGTIGYVTETQGYVMFIAGFQTAYNMQTQDTCDIFSGFSSTQLLTWAENYCRQQPLGKFSAAIVAMAQEVHPRRLQSCR